MSFVLGMDTGGTYTDGVIVDMDTKKIVSKAKALTTKEDLTQGIDRCLEALDQTYFAQVRMVSISTTLATNAIVEGRGASTGLLYMGPDPDEPVPADIVRRIKGRISIMGEIVEDPDEKELDLVLAEMKSKVDAIAVSGYASVRNPKHEQMVMTMIREKTDIPVVGAHQLTTSLGFHQRTVTAVLNGRLIPVIDELLGSTRKVLQSRGITAPVMVVKGDGTLMTEEVARKRPVETILSGPAASVIGALAMTGKKDGIVLDMGGTTSDFAEIEDGRVRIKKEGAKVGGWFTRVRAVEISTFGLGGDSLIALDKKGKLTIGPKKVWPLCIIGSKYPGLIHEIRNFKRVGEFKFFSEHEADCYIYQGGSAVAARIDELSDDDQKILALLKDRPHSISYLADAVGKDPEIVILDHLVEAGLIARVAFTPTDLMHILGKYDAWDKDIAVRGAQILAERMEISDTRFIATTEKMIYEKIARTMLQSIADFEEESMDLEGSPETMMLLDRMLGHRPESVFDVKIRLKKPVVAIGAPAGQWVPPAGEKLDSQVLVPAHADVANAYGAAVGQVLQQEELLITLIDGRYVLSTSWGRFEYTSKEEAIFYAIHEGRKQIEHFLMDAGCHVWQIDEAFEDLTMEVREGEGQVYTGTKVVLTGRADALRTRT